MSRRPSKAAHEIEELVSSARKLTARGGFKVGLAIGSIVTVLVGIFIFQNGDRADLQFLTFDFNVPLWMGLLAAFGAGCFAAPVLGWSWRRHRQNANERKAATSQLKQAEKDLTH